MRLIDGERAEDHNPAGRQRCEPPVLNAMVHARAGTHGRVLIGLALAAAALCALAGSNLHSDSHGHTHAVTSIPGALLAFAAAGMLMSGRRRPTRHAVIAGLGLVLVLAVTVFAFQTALHSVHHLGDADAERGCSVFGATDHLSGAPIPATAIEVPAAGTDEAVAVGVTWLLPQQPIRPAAGRAPPVPVLG
jgi:hypothetical protein